MDSGVFIFHADSSLVMATHPTIASEFNALDSSSWLFTAFALAGAATQNTVSLFPGSIVLQGVRQEQASGRTLC